MNRLNYELNYERDGEKKRAVEMAEIANRHLSEGHVLGEVVSQKNREISNLKRTIRKLKAAQ